MDYLQNIISAYDSETQTVTAFGRTYTAQHLIRSVLIIGAYFLLRPYLLKLSSKHQERDHAREMTASEESSMAATGVVKGDDGEEGEDTEGWGAKAWRRERERRKRAELESERQVELGEESEEELEGLLKE